jgi:hypothetical protein
MAVATVTRLILAAALLLAYVVVVRIVRAGTPEPEDEMATAFLDSPPIRIRLPEQATVTWRH